MSVTEFWLTVGVLLAALVVALEDDPPQPEKANPARARVAKMELAPMVPAPMNPTLVVMGLRTGMRLKRATRAFGPTAHGIDSKGTPAPRAVGGHIGPELIVTNATPA